MFYFISKAYSSIDFDIRYDTIEMLNGKIEKLKEINKHGVGILILFCVISFVNIVFVLTGFLNITIFSVFLSFAPLIESIRLIDLKYDIDIAVMVFNTYHKIIYEEEEN
jgi:hypothetical protein